MPEIQTIQKTAIFLNNCCGSGMKFLKEWKLKNPDIKVLKAYNLLQCRDNNFQDKYHFELEDLHKYCFIVTNDNGIEEVFKGEV